tara:strand:+ start:3158 stop:3667 length:510 start_codon:yes stop_codon:yes gene_type:complete
MQKRGSIQISFGMIFSIIIIIAIVGTAIYAITSFVGIGKATEMALFHQEFQESVNDVWATSITNKIVKFGLPTGIELVCFGSLESNNINQDYSGEFDELRRYSNNLDKQNANRFIYPIDKAGDFTFSKVEKIDLSELDTGFECFEVRNGELKVRLVKGQNDALVKLKEL